jgi:hypothetical protein
MLNRGPRTGGLLNFAYILLTVLCLSPLAHADIVKAAGGENVANIQQFTVNANSSGQFVITFTSIVNNALISGIEID